MNTDRYNELQILVRVFRSALCQESPLYIYIYIYIYIYTQVVPGGRAKLRENVPYAKIYRYNPKHLYPKLNGYGDNGQRKVWSSGGSTHCTCQLSSLIDVCP